MRMGTGCGAMEENGVIQVGMQASLIMAEASRSLLQSTLEKRAAGMITTAILSGTFCASIT